MINIWKYILGPLENNTYVIADIEKKKTVIIDPSAPSKKMAEDINNNGLSVEAILLTHAHFDHLSGVSWVIKQTKSKPDIALHEGDLQLWKDGGGSREFGFELDLGENPNLFLRDKDQLSYGGINFTVFSTPGHTPGHVTYYFPEKSSAFCGDLIFMHGVGRTDLAYGNEEKLISSIRQKIFTLPGGTTLYPGHGPKTTVAHEAANNPFLN